LSSSSRWREPVSPQTRRISIGSLTSVNYEFELEGDELQAEIQRFAEMKPHPMSMQDILSMEDIISAARFIYNEVPIRYAERIRAIEALDDWQSCPDLVEVHRRHIEVFREIRLVRNVPRKASFSDPASMMAFNEVVEKAASLQADVHLRLALAMHRLHKERPEKWTSVFVDHWLDDFLLNWIGSELLLSQYRACASWRPTGVIDTECDVAQVCREVAVQMQEMCRDLIGRVPTIVVESHSAAGDDRGAPKFSYIPGFLKYILQEIVKNACRATIDAAPNHNWLAKRKIKIIVCANHKEVAIRISDRARGIPFEVGAQVWSYMYSTGRKVTKLREGSESDKGKIDVEGATPLAGYGLGLPLSRLYARYLGGSLGLVSWPGYGTDVHLFLPRPDKELREVVPDHEADGVQGEWSRSCAEDLFADQLRKGDDRVKDFVNWVFDDTKKR
jgi:pyruvate dehydrogenase kinase 2/3/4